MAFLIDKIKSAYKKAHTVGISIVGLVSTLANMEKVSEEIMPSKSKNDVPSEYMINMKIATDDSKIKHHLLELMRKAIQLILR